MTRYRAALAVLAGGLACAGAWGQAPPPNILEQQRLIDDKLADARQRAAPLESLVDWQWGGWVEHYTFHFDDGVQSSRWLQRPGVALWTRFTLDGGAHEIFARTKLTYEYFRPGDEYDRQQDWIGPNLERGWYQVDVGRAFRLTTPADPLQMKIRLGRQEVMFGTGYVLDLPLDAVTFDSQLDKLRIRGLFGRTPGSTPNIDRSPPVASHSARWLYGVEASYTGLERHVPFVYALWNDDFTDERTPTWFQNYTYDTQYYGIGSRGELAHNLRYWAEGVFETGRSWGDGRWLVRDKVRAWGLDAGLEYLFEAPLRPRASFEYMYASGDGDRVGSTNSAAGGNLRGHDTAFNAFGVGDTGIAAGMGLSNVHIWRLGGSFTPFEHVQALRELELGTNWFLYHKNHRSGAVSDLTADRGSGYVGWEMDYFLNWRLTSDLSWTVRWGAFFPGAAYSDRDTRHFVFTGVTWSF